MTKKFTPSVKSLLHRWVRSRPLKGSAFVLMAVAVVWGGYETYEKVASRWAMKEAKDLVKKGFPAVAADKLDPFRHEYLDDKDDCITLLDVYLTSRRTDRLDWASQACLSQGHDEPEIRAGLAAVYELNGQDNQALNILNTAITQFPKSAILYLRAAKILQRNKSHENAVKAYMEAVKYAPEAESLAMEALQYFSSLKKWPEARMMADKIKGVPTENPEIKLLIARALKNGGDPSAAGVLISEANSLLAKGTVAQKEGLEKAYADLFSPEKAPAPMESPTPPNFKRPRAPRKK